MDRLKVCEAADLAPDTYEGEYFQPSVKVYKEEDVDHHTRATDEVIRVLVEALSNMVQMAKGCNWDKYTTGRQILLSDAEKALAQARKHLDE